MNFHIVLFLTDYNVMTVAETVDIVDKIIRVYCHSTHFRYQRECKQPRYFFIILDEDSWGILIVIPCKRIIMVNCITAKVKPDHYMILLRYQSPTRTP